MARIASSTTVWRPTTKDLLAAKGKKVSDIIAPSLSVLFVGINPGLYSGAVGHHFARPGNRFWPTLHRSGFTKRLLSPFEERELLTYGCGITNLVNRSTGAASELQREELAAGGQRLKSKVKRYRPRIVAILGIGAYRAAWGQRNASLGLQERMIGDTRVWVLPNPSGLNANYQLKDFVRLFRDLRRSAERERL